MVFDFLDQAGLHANYQEASKVLAGCIHVRTRHLDGLPFKLLRARNPQVMHECLTAAQAIATMDLDTVSQQFLDPDSSLFHHCVSHAQGNGISSELDAALAIYEIILIDETSIEV